MWTACAMMSATSLRWLARKGAVDDEIDIYIQPNAPLCPPGECKDMHESTDEDGVVTLICGWCGQTQMALG